MLSGETPIALDWTYNFPGLLPEARGGRLRRCNVVVPTDGVYGSLLRPGRRQGLAHPCAARLWIEHILSDEGALGYLEGGAIPARYAALDAAGKITDDMKKNLPAAELIDADHVPDRGADRGRRRRSSPKLGPDGGRRLESAPQWGVGIRPTPHLRARSA